MRAIKISDKSYEYLKRRAEKDRRPLTSTVDLIIEAEEKKCKKKSGHQL